MKRPAAWIKRAWRRLVAAPGRPAQRRVLLCVTALEDRTTPATFAQVGTALNIDLTTASSSVSIQSTGTSYVFTLNGGDTWTSADIGSIAVKSNSNATLTLTAASFPVVNVTDSAAGVAVSFIPSTGAYSSDFTVTLNDAPGAVTLLGPANFGANDLTIDTAYQIAVLPGTTVTAATGDITFRANVQTAPTAGTFDGILINPVATLSITGSGNLTLEGRGGTNAIGSQRGVAVLTMGTVSGGTGALTITGTGGVSSGGNNHGVAVDGFFAQVTSAGGNVSVTGTGGGDSSSTSNSGVFVGNAGSIKAGGSGTVSVTGTGGAGTGSDNNGVTVFNALTTITSGGGDVAVTGTAGGGTSAGIAMVSALATITTLTNSGDITMTADSMNLDATASTFARTSARYTA